MSRVDPLEARYRRLLRLLPASYRGVREEEMVTTFLDRFWTGDDERDELIAVTGRPGAAEAISTVALAVRVRLGGGDAAPRPRLWGAAVRRFALVGLLVHAIASTVAVVRELWLASVLPWPAVPDPLQAALAQGAAPPWVSAVSVVGLLWLAAYVALVCGRRRAGKVAATAALLLALIDAGTILLGTGVWSWWWAIAAVVQVAIAGAVVVSLAAFHPDAPPVDRRPWLLALPVGLVVAAAPGLLLVRSVPQGVAPLGWLDWPGLQSLVLVVAGTVHLAVRRLRVAPEWTLALALLAVPVVLVRLATWVPIVAANGSPSPGFPVAGAVQTAAVLGVGVVSAVVASRGLRSLPTRCSSASRSLAPSD